MPHSLEVSRLALKKAKDEKRIMRVCWETNGYMNPKLAERATEHSLESGGNIKFDLKAWDEGLNVVLCGVSNRPALENFVKIGKFYEKRGEVRARYARRPHVVQFGEPIDPKVLTAAFAASREAELFLVIGTSGVVSPASTMPWLALKTGAKVVEINPHSTVLTTNVSSSLRGKAAEILPRLWKELVCSGRFLCPTEKGN